MENMNKLQIEIQNKLQIEIQDNIFLLDKSFKFSGGEVQIRLPDLPKIDQLTQIYIRTWLTSSDRIMELLLTKDALTRKYPHNKINLICDYFPYARQDRPCVHGEAFSLEVICNIINSANFNQVFISDAHSDVTLTLLRNVVESRQFQIINNIILDNNIEIEKMVICSPDQGALEKIKELGNLKGMTPVHAYKVRDPDTGNIIETRIDIEDFEGKDIFIIDDVCDGGRTFIELAKVLKTKNSGKLYLYVTHAIFSKGIEVVLEHFDHIYTTNSFYQGDHPKVTMSSLL